MHEVETENIAHLFRDDAPHLNTSISAMVVRNMPNCKVYVADMGEATTSKEFRTEKNAPWISALPANCYQGNLDYAWWTNLHKKGRIFGLLKAMLNYTLLPCFSVKSLCSVARGPKYWVLHGSNWTFPTLLAFRLLGKRIILIHWGGHLLTWQRVRLLTNLGYHFFDRVYVLMSPEEREFIQAAGACRVSTLSYPMKDGAFEKMIQCPDWRISNQCPRVMLLGNNGFRMNTYSEILDKLNPNDWDCIVCMLNYGAPANVIEFIGKYRAKFGERFYPWVDTLPYAEYVKIMSECSIYICPCAFQTGLHASYLSALSGRALVLRGQNYEWFKHLGVDVTDLDALSDFSFESIASCVPSDQKYARNIMCLRHYFTEVATEKNWTQTILEAFHD